MLRQLAPLIVLTVALSGCAPATAERPPLTPVPSPGADGAAQALINIQAQSTLEALRATSQIIEANLTATAYAPTAQWIGTSTAQAWTVLGWTATASIGQTATAASGTATQQAVQATGTQQTLNITATIDAAAASAKATALHGEAVSVELAIERERLMNDVWAVTPWAILVGLLAVLSAIAWRWSRVRPILRDARGDAPLLIVDGKIYDADRNPQSLLDLSGKKPAIPALTDPNQQAATTARDQMIDLAARAGIGAQSAHKLLEQNPPPPAAPQISLLSAEASRPLLRDVLPGIVRDTINVDILDEDKPDE